MATMLQKKGTCPACMGVFHLYAEGDKVVVGRHGWQEVGGRQVGVYGLASHVGECFGVGWAPFEISAEGTWAFLNQVVYPSCLSLISFLARLASFPALHVEVRNPETRKDEIVVISPDSEEGRKLVGFFSKETVYERAHKNKVSETEAALDRNSRIGRDLTLAALSWTPGEIQDAPPEGPTVHFKKEGARGVFCGSRSYSVTHVSDETLVTCTRCLKALETSKKEQEIYDGITADAETLVGHLRDHGPQTKVQIKKTFGWDTKRVNKAIERAEGWTRRIGVPAERLITSEYSAKGPDKYRVSTEEERARWAR